MLKVRRFVLDIDEVDWLSVWNAVYGVHVDQTPMTVEEIRIVEKSPDFDSEGRFIAELDDARARLRTRLKSIEGHASDRYFSQIFGLIPELVRPEYRKTFKAYDGINNVFNLAYEMLSWKAHHALIKAKLEPYLGFLDSIAEGKPSLICDFMELYRYLIDDFVIQYCQKLQKRDFIMKYEDFSSNRKGKREYLNDSLTRGLVKSLNEYFQTKVEIPRIRMGKKQEIETLINEEAMLFAMYLRRERETWVPRILSIQE